MKYIILLLLFFQIGCAAVKYQPPTIISTRIFVEDGVFTTRYYDDLQIAEDILYELNIKFEIISIETVCRQDWIKSRREALIYPDSLNLYYVTADRVIFHGIGFSTIQGESCYPWNLEENGICIAYDAIPKPILAHEIGHWLGLQHTFDLSETLTDTFDPSEYTLGLYSEYNNLMNYHSNDDFSFLTPQQLEIMNLYLRTTRQNSIKIFRKFPRRRI